MCFQHETRNESQQALVKLPVRSCETMIASAEIYNLWVQEHYFHYYFYYWLAIQLNYRSALRSLWLPSCHASKSTDLFNTLCGYLISTKSTMTSSSGRIHVWHTIHYLTESESERLVIILNYILRIPRQVGSAYRHALDRPTDQNTNVKLLCQLCRKLYIDTRSKK